MIEELKGFVGALLKTNQDVIDKETKGQYVDEFEKGSASTAHLAALMLQQIIDKYDKK